jgi:peptidoglycan hydrolase CwlO-like protein
LANPSTQSTSSIQAAKSKLDAALDRLDKAIETKAKSSNGSGAGNGKLGKELTAAKAEISELKEKNQVVSTRLDGAIDRMKEILES